jgi:hypothetical protein
MRCSKRVGKYQALKVLSLRHHIQVFQRRKFSVYGCNEPLKIRQGNPKANAAHAISELEGKHDPLFIFCRNISVGIFAKVIENKRKTR